jgi:hypothetical protein
MLVFLISASGVEIIRAGTRISDNFSPPVLRKLHMPLSIPSCTPCRTASVVVMLLVMEAGAHV